MFSWTFAQRLKGALLMLLIAVVMMVIMIVTGLDPWRG
jgi:hypothetical protein